MQAPVLAVGDGALGFWAALAEVWPHTKCQRCWFHKMGNVLDKLLTCVFRRHGRNRFDRLQALPNTRCAFLLVQLNRTTSTAPNDQQCALLSQ